MKARILPPDTVIRPDEKVWFLTELVEVVLGLPGRQRIQRTYIVRGDEICVVEKILGDAENFEGPQFRIPSLMEHTAGEMWDLADWHRDPSRMEHFLARAKEIQGESSLVQDWTDWLHARARLIQNQSVFGPGIVKQRNDFSPAGVQEKLKERVKRTYDDPNAE